MPEIVGTFLRTEQWDERANCSIEARNSSCRNLAQECLEFAVRQLDRVEIGRVFRQVAKCRPRFLDRLPNARPQMDPAVVHHDDVASLERGNQALLDIGEEHLAGHGAPSPDDPTSPLNGLFDPNRNLRIAGYMFNEFKFGPTTKAQASGRVENVWLKGMTPAF